MKVLQINTVYENGGSTGRIVADLVDEQRSSSIEPFVAYGYGRAVSPDEASYVYRITSDLELFVSKVRTKLFGRHGFDNKSETRKLLKWIDEVNPDIIHLHNIHNHYVNIELLLNYIADKNIPTVLTMHDCWTFTGWCAYFDYPRCDKWIEGCHDCRCLNKYPRTWFRDMSRKNYQDKKRLFDKIDMTIVTPSQWLADLVARSFLKKNRVEVINNGTDLTKFYPQTSDIRQKLGIETSKHVMLGMAFNFESRKGINYLFRLNELDRKDWQLVLVGVPAAMMKRVPAGIIAIAQTSDVDYLRRLYSMADVFVNPTFEDNFPTTNIEALACGTPVVTFRTGGSIEAVDDETGVVVEQGNFGGLVDAIDSLLAKDRSLLKTACRRRAEFLYDKHKQFGKYITLYKNILK